MGMFDYVQYECPDCGNYLEGQTKAGRKILATYHADPKLPLRIAADQHGETIWCNNCNREYEIRATKKNVKMKLVRVQ